jgi:hypothetical protein
MYVYICSKSVKKVLITSVFTICSLVFCGTITMECSIFIDTLPIMQANNLLTTGNYTGCF